MHLEIPEIGMPEGVDASIDSDVAKIREMADALLKATIVEAAQLVAADGVTRYVSRVDTATGERATGGGVVVRLSTGVSTERKGNGLAWVVDADAAARLLAALNGGGR